MVGIIGYVVRYMVYEFFGVGCCAVRCHEDGDIVDVSASKYDVCAIVCLVFKFIVFESLV